MTSAVLVQCSTNWELVTVLVPNKPVKWWIKDREDRFHIHVFPRSSNIWLSCIHSRSRSYLLPHSEDIGYVTIKFTWSLGLYNIHIIPPRWQFIRNQIFLSPLSTLCWWQVIPPFPLKTMGSPPKSSNIPLLVSNSSHRLLPRSRTCIHRLSRGRCSDAFGPSMVGAVFLYGLLAGTRQRGTRVNLQFIKLWTGYLVCFTSLCINIAENTKAHIMIMTSNFCLISSLWALRDL